MRTGMMNLLLSLFIACFISIPSRAQQWERQDGKDAFSGTDFVRFTLKGKFIVSPHQGNLAEPIWVTTCQPKHTHDGNEQYDGLLEGSFIDFGAVLNSDTLSTVAVAYRLDDGKTRIESWGKGTAGTAAFLGRITLNTVLYGHFLPHRANSNPPTKKLVVMVDEAFAAKIVAEFDIPDPDEMARACGTTYHKD